MLRVGAIATLAAAAVFVAACSAGDSPDEGEGGVFIRSLPTSTALPTPADDDHAHPDPDGHRDSGTHRHVDAGAHADAGPADRGAALAHASGPNGR